MAIKYVVYGRPGCAFCTKALDLLDKHEIEYEYRDVNEPDHMYALKQLLPNVKTIPQVFTIASHIGGFDELQKELSDV